MIYRNKNMVVCTGQCKNIKPNVCYDYACKARNPSLRQVGQNSCYKNYITGSLNFYFFFFPPVELLTPVKEEKWFEAYKTELEFLREHFSEVLPEILEDVVRKRVADPTHYIVHRLIKYKVDKSMNAYTSKRLF